MDKTVIDAMARWPNVPDVYGWLSLNEQGKWRLHPQGDALPAAGRPGSFSGDGKDALPADRPGPLLADESSAPSADAPGALPAGEPITSPPILQFIGRNYAADDSGQWYFQNGPQRVYVRLDAAPFIFHTAGGTHTANDTRSADDTYTASGAHNTAGNALNASATVRLRTHTGVDAGPVLRWLLADDGRLYAQTAQGPGLVAGRDLENVLAALCLPDGQPLIDALADGQQEDGIRVHAAGVSGHAAAGGAPGLAQAASDSGKPGQTRQDGTDSALAQPAKAYIPFDFCPADGVPRRLGFVRFPKPKAS